MFTIKDLWFVLCSVWFILNLRFPGDHHHWVHWLIRPSIAIVIVVTYCVRFRDALRGCEMISTVCVDSSGKGNWFYMSTTYHTINFFQLWQHHKVKNWHSPVLEPLQVSCSLSFSEIELKIEKTEDSYQFYNTENFLKDVSLSVRFYATKTQLIWRNFFTESMGDEGFGLETKSLPWFSSLQAAKFELDIGQQFLTNAFPYCVCRTSCLIVAITSSSR